MPNGRPPGGPTDTVTPMGDGNPLVGQEPTGTIAGAGGGGGESSPAFLQILDLFRRGLIPQDEFLSRAADLGISEDRALRLVGQPRSERAIREALSRIGESDRRKLAGQLGMNPLRLDAIVGGEPMSGAESQVLNMALFGQGGVGGVGGVGRAGVSGGEMVVATFEFFDFLTEEAERLGRSEKEVLELILATAPNALVDFGVNPDLLNQLLGTTGPGAQTPAEVVGQELAARRQLSVPNVQAMLAGGHGAGALVPAGGPAPLPGEELSEPRRRAMLGQAVARRSEESLQDIGVQRLKEEERKQRIEFLEGLDVLTAEQVEELRRLKAESAPVVAAHPGQFAPGGSPIGFAPSGQITTPVSPTASADSAMITSLGRALLSWAQQKASNPFSATADINLQSIIASATSAVAGGEPGVPRTQGVQFGGQSPLAAAIRYALQLLQQLGFEGNPFAAQFLQRLLDQYGGGVASPTVPPWWAPGSQGPPAREVPPTEPPLVVPAVPGQFAVPGAATRGAAALSQPRRTRRAVAGFAFAPAGGTVQAGGDLAAAAPAQRLSADTLGARVPQITFPPGVNLPPGIFPPGTKPPPTGPPNPVEDALNTIRQSLQDRDPRALAALELARALGVPVDPQFPARMILYLVQNPSLLAGSTVINPDALAYLELAAASLGVSKEAFEFAFQRFIPGGTAQLVTAGF